MNDDITKLDLRFFACIITLVSSYPVLKKKKEFLICFGDVVLIVL
jgi:hypothetical protein